MMILVTGATGFLGRSLVPCLLENGHRVRAAVRQSSDTAFLERQGVELVPVADIGNYDDMAGACHECTAVIHAAARFRMWGNLVDFWQTNVEGTAATLEAAWQAGAKRFLYISSVAVIGKTIPGRIVDESHPCQPQDHYQRTKLEAEKLALAYQRLGRVPVVVVRPGALYGPWGNYAFNRLFFEDPLRGLRIKVNRGQHITFPAYIKDVSVGIVAALTEGRPGQIYHLTGRALSHNEVNAVVSELSGISRRRLNIPTGPVLLLARVLTALSRFTGKEPFYPSNLAHYVFQDWPVSFEKAARELGFQPTPFVEGARQTVEWYRQRRMN